MGGAKRSTWIGGTIFVALVIVAAAWFLAISPMFAAAAESRAQAESTRQENQLQELKITQLKADFAKLPEYKAELAAIRGQLPADAELSAYLRQLNEIAAARSVVITSIAPAAPVAFVPAIPVVVAPAPVAADTTTTTTTAADAAATTPAAPSGPVVPAGFAAIPFTLTVVGTYDNTLAFLADVQSATSRLVLVSGLAGTAQDESEASGGRPATAVGDQELVLTGFAYVLPDPAAAPAPVDTSTLPGAVGGKNPLIPVGGK